MTDPRPQRLNQASLAEEVLQTREMQDLFKVYRPEWVIVYTSQSLAAPKDDGCVATEECLTYYSAKYEGRVRDEDWKMYSTSPNEPAHLYLRLPNLKGEFKHYEDAQAHIADRGWSDAVIVVRSSRAEHELLAYSVRKLPDHE